MSVWPDCWCRAHTREQHHRPTSKQWGWNLARKSIKWVQLSTSWCARLDRDPARSALGFGQQVASLVLWFGLGGWLTRLTGWRWERWYLHPTLHVLESGISVHDDLDDGGPARSERLCCRRHTTASASPLLCFWSSPNYCNMYLS